MVVGGENDRSVLNSAAAWHPTQRGAPSATIVCRCRGRACSAWIVPAHWGSWTGIGAHPATLHVRRPTATPSSIRFEGHPTERHPRRMHVGNSLAWMRR